MLGGQVELWEALVQFGLYWGYVFLMMNNEKVEAWVKSSRAGQLIEGKVKRQSSGVGSDVEMAEKRGDSVFRYSPEEWKKDVGAVLSENKLGEFEAAIKAKGIKVSALFR